jgi:WD40 repeat protein
MKDYKVLLLFFTFFLTGCSLISFNKTTQLPTSSLPAPASTILPSPSASTEIVAETPVPSYKIITERTIDQIALLHQWDVENIFEGNETFWFSDSARFIVPISETPSEGILFFDVGNSEAALFMQTSSLQATIDEKDRVITYNAGLHIFNRNGEEIKLPQSNNSCNETVASSIIFIPNSDLIVTGHQDSISDSGLNNNNNDRARLLLWDGSKNLCSILQEFDGRLSSLSSSLDGGYISYSIVLRTMDLSNGTLVVKSETQIYDMHLKKEACHLGGLFAKFDSRNNLVVYDPGELTISFIEPSSCLIQRKFNIETRLSSFSLSPGGNLLAGVSLSGIITIWNIRTGKKIYEINSPTPTGLSLISFSPNGYFLITASGKSSSSGKDKVMLWGVPEK